VLLQLLTRLQDTKKGCIFGGEQPSIV